jgi:hypothetical protein
VVPDVTVVLVSDYGGGPAEHEELIEVVSALSRQKTAHSVEYLLVHHSESPACERTLHGLRVLVSTSGGSYRRKNEGVLAACGEWIALLDADCVPAVHWIDSLLRAAAADSGADAFSGPTFYAGGSLATRVLSLLARGYLDPGSDTTTRYIANNNCLMRREVYLACPLPEDAGAFAAHIQSESLRRHGSTFRFVESAAVTHAFAGWAMERDLRRNTGYITIHGRRIDPTLPFSWLLHLGWASLPFFACGKLLHRLGDLFRCRARYHIGWREMPSAMLLAVYVQLLELPGMALALSRRPLGESMWR